MAEIYEIIKYYASDYLTADGDALTQRTATVASTDQIIVSASLTQADDFWNEALLFFDTDTTTSALQGQYMEIVDSDQGDTSVTLAYPLPATPAGTDTFRIVKGGQWRSTYRLPGKTVDSGPVNVTGVTIDYTSEKNADGSGTLSYINTGQFLTWQDADDLAAGVAVAVGAGGTFIIESQTVGKWLEVTVAGGSLPGSDQSDTIILSTKTQTRLSDATGAQTFGGNTSYYAEVYKNEAVTTANTFGFYMEDPAEVTTTMAAPLGLTADLVAVADGSSFPSTSFWLYNSTKNDIRWVNYRSGNDFAFFASGSGDERRGFTAQSWDTSDVVQIFTSVDIAYDDPTGTEFESDLTALTYSSPLVIGDALRLAPLAADGITMLAYREVIPAGARGRSSIKDSVNYCWE